MIFNIDKFYIKINKHIDLIKAFTEIKNIDNIIKYCRLKPYNFDYKSKYKKIILFKEWYDEFGNLLQIHSSKKIKISYNNLKIRENFISTSDIYYGIDIQKVVKISKCVFIFYGKEDDSIDDFIFINFLGIDNYFRSYIYTDNEWQRISPLYLGMHNLNLIINNTNITKHLYIRNRKDFISPCKRGRAWISCLPVNEDFIKVLSKENDIVKNILKGI